MANHNKRKQRNEPMRARSKYMQPVPSATKRGKTCDQVAIGFGFTFDWLTRWREFYKPITERSKAKPKKFRMTVEGSITQCLCFFRFPPFTNAFFPPQNQIYILFLQEHILEHTDIVKLARLPLSAAASEGLQPSPSSILKKESRISRHALLDSPLKSSPSRGLRNTQMGLRFAADVKQS